MFNEEFFFSTASILFIVLSFKYIKSFILSCINNRIAVISDKFDEVSSILEDSEKLLEKYKDLHNRYDHIIKEMEVETKDEIVALKLRAENEVKDKLEHKTSIIETKIQRNRLKVLSDLREQAIHAAIQSSVVLLENHKDLLQPKLINESINNISKNIK